MTFVTVWVSEFLISIFTFHKSIPFDIVCKDVNLYLPLNLGIQNETSLVSNMSYIVISVTRWWNKKLSNFLPKVPKKLPHTFYIIVTLLEKAPKVTKMFGLLLRENLLPWTCKNRPIWSHWLWYVLVRTSRNQ